jgi:hypothetical protein
MMMKGENSVVGKNGRKALFLNVIPGKMRASWIAYLSQDFFLQLGCFSSSSWSCGSSCGGSSCGSFRWNLLFLKKNTGML